MALVNTTLNGAITQNATQLALTSATGVANKMLVRVDAEIMRVTDVSLSPTVQVVRGYAGTFASAHNTLAVATYGVTGDWSQGTGVAGQPVYSYSVDGAITVPEVNQTIIIDKGSAAALTLAAPKFDLNNTVTITSATAYAHTITAVALLGDGTAAPKSTATMGAFAGATLNLQAIKGIWNVTSVENVALA